METESIAMSRLRRLVPPMQMYEHSNLLAYALNVEHDHDCCQLCDKIGRVFDHSRSYHHLIKFSLKSKRYFSITQQARCIPSLQPSSLNSTNNIPIYFAINLNDQLKITKNIFWL